MTLTRKDVVNRPRRILVVEDEPLILATAVAMLEHRGYETLAAGCAEEAIDHLLDRAADIDVVFTDVKMPGKLDGAELAFLIRSRWPKIGIVVVSGHFDPSVSRLPMGASFLAKPYRSVELRAAIDTQLASVGKGRHAVSEAGGGGSHHACQSG